MIVKVIKIYNLSKTWKNVKNRRYFLYQPTSLQTNPKVLYHGLEFALGIIDMLVLILLLYCYYEYVQNFGERNLKEKVAPIERTTFLTQFSILKNCDRKMVFKILIRERKLLKTCVDSLWIIFGTIKSELNKSENGN